MTKDEILKEKFDITKMRIDNIWAKFAELEKEKKQETGRDLLGRDVKERIAELERNFKCLYNRVKKLEDSKEKVKNWSEITSEHGRVIRAFVGTESKEKTEKAKPKPITITLQYDNFEMLLWDIDFLKRLHHPILDNATKFDPNPDTTDASKK